MGAQSFVEELSDTISTNASTVIQQDMDLAPENTDAVFPQGEKGVSMTKLDAFVATHGRDALVVELARLIQEKHLDSDTLSQLRSRADLARLEGIDGRLESARLARK